MPLATAPRMFSSHCRFDIAKSWRASAFERMSESRSCPPTDDTRHVTRSRISDTIARIRLDLALLGGAARSSAGADGGGWRGGWSRASWSAQRRRDAAEAAARSGAARCSSLPDLLDEALSGLSSDLH